jgi:multiple sugar transport system substrate-binding protein
MGTDAPNVDIPEETLVDFELVVKAIPQFDVENQKMISQGPSICIFNKKNTNEVLASWLFTQFLLTNKVQIDYAKTEGYVPVTKKAQNSPEYTDYLSRSGENNDEYYAPKIEASKILLNNLDNTFITPVFNGSANLRNAAGQLIEEVCKAVDRNKTVNKQFLEELYSKISTLYHLEEIGSSGVGRAKIDFDGIPAESKILIYTIAGVWLLLGLWYIVNFVKSRKKS